MAALRWQRGGGFAKEKAQAVSSLRLEINLSDHQP
jgi:hypothetical protein